jgi:hypothetical protein
MAHLASTRIAAALSALLAGLLLATVIPGVTQERPPEIIFIGEADFEPRRLENFTRPRVRPGRTFPAFALERARAQAELLPALWKGSGTNHVVNPFLFPSQPFIATDNSTLGGWASLGPAPICKDYFLAPEQPCFFKYTGRISAIAAHPKLDTVIYVASAGGGVWKTTNGSQSWTPLFDAMPSMDVGALALDPHHPETVFAGTGSRYSTSYGAVGVFVSKNGGASWAQAGGTTFTGCTIARFAFHAEIPGVVLAAASLNETSAPTNITCLGGVYASLNGGKTWIRWLENPKVTDVIVAGSQVFAGVEGEGVLTSQVLQTAFGTALLASSWTQVTGGLPTSDMSRVRLVSAPSNPMRLYAAIGLFGSPALIKGIWWSNNGGLSWTASTKKPNDNYWFMGFAVSPKDPDTAYFGGTTLWRTVDGGVTFEQLTNLDTGPVQTIHVDTPAIAYDALGRVLLGTDGGLFLTTDGAAFANLNTNLSIVQLYAISGTLAGGTVLPAGPLLAGAQDNGTMRYQTGTVWKFIGFGGDGGPNAVNPENGAVLYVSAQMQNLGKSENYGDDVDVISDPQWYTQGGPWFSPLALDRANPDRLLVGVLQVWETLNAAGSWKPISPDFGGISAIAPAPSAPGTLYVASGDGLRLTLNGGLSWNDISAGLPDRYITRIAVHDTQPNQAWIAMSGFGGGHIFHTSTSGGSWQDVSTSLPDTPVNALAIDTRHTPAWLFAGTDIGVFISLDNGAHWARSGGGLPNTFVNDLVLDLGTNKLLAATFGRGVWAASLHMKTMQSLWPTLWKPNVIIKP